MRKNKIGIIIPRLGVIDRGAEIFVYELSQELQKDASVVLWVRKEAVGSYFVKDLQKKGILIKTAGCISEQNWLANIFNQVKPVRYMLDMLHLNPVEIEMLTFTIACYPSILLTKCDLLFPNNGVWGALACRFIRRIIGTPFIYTSHGGIEPMIAKQKPDLYIASNKQIYAWMRKYFSSLKVVAISHGVNIKRFSNKGKKSQYRLEKPIFLSVGALIPAKRFDKVIQAVTQLKRGSLVILGNGYLEKTLKNLGNQLLGKGRFLLTRTGNNKIPAFYRGADIFTSATKGTPFDLVFLEALACGLPVVANNEGHIKDLIGKAGIKTNVDYIADYSQALLRATQTDFGQFPRLQAEKFSWEVIGKKYRQEIASLLQL